MDSFQMNWCTSVGVKGHINNLSNDFIFNNTFGKGIYIKKRFKFGIDVSGLI